MRSPACGVLTAIRGDEGVKVVCGELWDSGAGEQLAGHCCRGSNSWGDLGMVTDLRAGGEKAAAESLLLGGDEEDGGGWEHYVGLVGQRWTGGDREKYSA